MTADYPGALWIPVPENYTFIGALDNKNHYAIVLHKTGNIGTMPTAQGQATYFSGPDNKIDMKSVHYVVGSDGVVVQCVSEKDGAGGNCCLESGYDTFWDSAPTKSNLNLCTFSIEHCSATPNGDNSDTMSHAQIDASFKLVSYLMKKYNIPLSRIKGHNTIAPGSRKNCPGNYPWAALIAYLSVPDTSTVTVKRSVIESIINDLNGLLK